MCLVKKIFIFGRFSNWEKSNIHTNRTSVKRIKMRIVSPIPDLAAYKTLFAT